MKRIFCLSLGLSCLVAHSQYSLTNATYSQDFDGLGINSSANVTGGHLLNIDASLEGWYFLELGTSGNTTITAGNGSSGTADTYNFGSTGDADRTLGSLRVGSDAIPVLNPRIGFYFTNNTGNDIEALQISYTGQTWRRGFNNRRDRLDFQYSTTATSLSTGFWTNVDALDYSNPVGGLPIGSGSILHSAQINNYVLDINIPDGVSLFIRWTDLDATDNDDGMGIDDFTMTVVDPTPVIFYSKSSGNLTLLSTWGSDPDGSGASPGSFTEAFHEFNVVNRASVTLNANWSVPGVRSKVIVGDAASSTTLVIPSTASLTGITDIRDLSTLRIEHTTLPAFGMLESGSTIEFAQPGTYVVPAGNYQHLHLTGGTKTLGPGDFIVAGDIVLDAVSNFNGASPPADIILSGNFTMQNGSAFAASGSRPFMTMVGEETQTISGGDVRLNSLQTLDEDPTTLEINLVNANLFLSGSGLDLLQSTHSLALNGNTLNLTSDATLGTGQGSITGSNTSRIVINRSGGTEDVGILRMTPGAETLATLEYRDFGTGNPLELGSPLSIVTSLVQHVGDDIITSPANLLTLLQGADITGPGLYNAFIIGPLARVTNAATDYLFPVGGKRIFLEIPFPGNTSTFSIEYFQTGIHVNNFPCDLEPISGFKINEYWDITRTNGSSPASFTIDFDGQNLADADWSNNVAPTNGDGIGIIHFIAGAAGLVDNCWEMVSTSVPILPFGQTTIGTGMMTSFSPFTFGYIDFANPLPVKFGNVRAYKHNYGVNVDWSNLTESNVADYTIERSADGRSFTPVATISPTGNNGDRADYTWFDAAPLSGLNFYRIRSRENDGKKLYSVIVRVEQDAAITKIYPNPVRDGLIVLQMPALDRGRYTINIFNVAGQKVHTIPLNHAGGFVTQSIQLPSGCKPGLYTLQLFSGNIKINQPFIMQ